MGVVMSAGLKKLAIGLAIIFATAAGAGTTYASYEPQKHNLRKLATNLNTSTTLSEQSSVSLEAQKKFKPSESDQCVAGTSYKAYLMPQGHTIFMTEHMYAQIDPVDIPELAKISAGKNVILSTPQEYLDNMPEEDLKSENNRYLIKMLKSEQPFAMSEMMFKGLHVPLNDIAPNVVIMPDLEHFAHIADLLGYNTPASLVPRPPIKEIWSYARFHEFGHIKSTVKRKNPEKPSDAYSKKMIHNENSSADEGFADSIALQACINVGKLAVAKYIKPLRAIKSFMDINRYGGNEGGENYNREKAGDHNTSILITSPPREDANAYLSDAKKYLASSEITAQILYETWFSIGDSLTDEEGKEIMSAIEKIFNKLKLPMESAWGERDETQAAQEVIGQYIMAKVLVAENKIKNSAQTACAKDYADSLKDAMNPEVLKIIESRIIPLVQKSVQNGDANYTLEQLEKDNEKFLFQTETTTPAALNTTNHGHNAPS